MQVFPIKVTETVKNSHFLILHRLDNIENIHEIIGGRRGRGLGDFVSPSFHLLLASLVLVRSSVVIVASDSIGKFF